MRVQKTRNWHGIERWDIWGWLTDKSDKKEHVIEWPDGQQIDASHWSALADAIPKELWHSKYNKHSGMYGETEQSIIDVAKALTEKAMDFGWLSPYTTCHLDLDAPVELDPFTDFVAADEL